MSSQSTPKKGKSAVSTPGRGTESPAQRGSPSTQRSPRTSSAASSDSPATRHLTSSPSSPASPVILPPIIKPSPCDLQEETQWIHDLRYRCMQNTIRSLSRAGKRQFRETGTWVELLDTLTEHQDECRDEGKKKGKGPVTPQRRGGARSTQSDDSGEGDVAKVITHALELLYAVGDDHGEDWSSEIDSSDALDRLQTFMEATPSLFFKRQSTLVYLLLNGRRPLASDHAAIVNLAEIYSAYHTRLFSDDESPYPCWSGADTNSGALYYERLDALSPLPRSPAPRSGTLRANSPARSSSGGFGTATLKSAAAALAAMQLPDSEPSVEAIDAGFATRYSDADPFAMLNHANKVLRMCWQKENLTAVLDLDVAKNAIAILGHANPLIAFYGEAFFHSIYARGRFIGQTLDDLYLPVIVKRIRAVSDQLERAEGNLQCLRELIDDRNPDTAAFVEAEVDAGIVQLALELLRGIVKKPPPQTNGAWHSVTHLTGILHCVVKHGAGSSPNAYRALFDQEKGLQTLAQIATLVPMDGTGIDTACLALCTLLRGEKPEPATLYGPVLRIVKNSMGRKRHETLYNAAWEGLVGAADVLAAYEKTKKK